MSTQKINGKHYSILENAFNHFNKILFETKLPITIITLSRTKHYEGGFRNNVWNNKDNIYAEIALNSNLLNTDNIIFIYATLVHEMCHQYQHIFGKPSTPPYHNKQFSKIMLSVGLETYDTLTGMSTGKAISHHIISGGKFEIAFANLPSNALIKMNARDLRDLEKDRSKIKYMCLGCETKVWGKPKLNLICGLCNRKFIVAPKESKTKYKN